MPSKPTPDPKRAIAYLRCSTSRQDLSPETQREAIHAWAEREGVTVVAWQVDTGVCGGFGCGGPSSAEGALLADARRARLPFREWRRLGSSSASAAVRTCLGRGRPARTAGLLTRA